MLRQLLILICLSAAACALRAQDLPPAKVAVSKDPMPPVPHFRERPVKAMMYGVNDGLSQGLVQSMTLDRYGRLWLATKDGLNCYTGHGFRTYRHDPDDKFSLAHDRVKSLTTDTLGRIWAVYATGKLGLFDPATESFTVPKFGAADSVHFENMVPFDGQRMLLRNIDSTHFPVHILASVTAEVDASFRLTVEPLDDEISDIPVAKHFFEIRSSVVQRAGDGTLWMATLDSVYRYGTLPNSSAPEWSRFAVPQGRSDQTEQYANFVADPEGGTAYVVDRNLILRRYDIRRNEFLPMLRLPSGTLLSGGIFLDSDKRLYLFHDNKEILRIQTNDNTCERLTPQWNRTFMSLNMQLRSALEDPQGNIWIGTPGSGVVQLNHNNDRFTAYTHPHKSYEAGIYKYAVMLPGSNPSHRPGLMKQWDDFRNRHIPGGEFTGKLGVDAKGYFWAVLMEGDGFSLMRMDSATGNAEVIFNEPIGAHEFGRAFYMGRDGRIWTNTDKPGAPSGLWSYRPATGETETYPVPPLPADGNYPCISQAYETPAGAWWLATRRGLFFFNPSDGDWKHFLHDPADSTSLSFDLCLSICPDPARPDRYLWIGTEGAGLNRLDLRDSTFRRFTVEDGLPNNVIYGILPDSHDNLWISTNQGLSHFHVSESTFVNYTARSGLAGNEFNRYEYAVAPDGTLLFGGTAGLTVIHPERFYDASAPAATLITGLKVQNTPVQFRPGHEGLLRAPIHAAERLELPYDHRMFALTFANLDLSNPEDNEFKYMLEGFDPELIHAGTAAEATYTNLNPGDYLFKVYGRNSHKVWNEEPATLHISILAPWWATWWFRTLAVLSGAGLLYGLYLYRLNSLLGMERLRNRIAQDLHDEIGSTLSSISLYSAVMQKSSNSLPQTTRDILGKIIDSTSEIMEKMSDMVWTIKSDNDHFGEVVHRMRAFAANVTDSQNIALQFDADPKVEGLKLDMDQRKNIYLIYKEAVINAMKYANCTELKIRIGRNRQFILLRIGDNGSGFDLEDAGRAQVLMGGNGIDGMRIRAEQLQATFHIHTSPDRGTVVELNVPLNH